MNLRKIYIILATTWLCLLKAKAIRNQLGQDSYSASTETLKSLLSVENILMKNLAEYVEQLKQKLSLVKRALTHFRAEELKMRSDNDYFDNPLNSFALLRHQRQDWLKWAAYMEQQPGTAQIAYAREMRAELPRTVDLQEASHYIELLVDYYELEPKDLAAGKLAGHSQPNTAFSMLDCYALAKFNLFQKNYAKAENWFNISLSKYDSRHNLLYKVFDFDESNILKWLGAVLIKRNEHVRGLQHLKRANSIRIDETSNHYQTKAIIQGLCSASFHRPSYLHCRYNNWMTPFLRIAPLKMEELSVDPIAVLYYDAIYDSEIEWFLNKSLNFIPALLDMRELSKDRTAQNVNFEDNGLEAVTLTLHKRLTDMTGFSMKGGDDLSLINYGIGGHYSLHLDAFEADYEGRGNRIATTLFYLSNVESGGATVFPELNLTVKPQKGTALVWHNLHMNGERHLKTWHTACPVLVGTKYVLTKWIYSFSQMFIKPCLANR
ncbi:prolyl 4-hydroxylase subunit alpha-2-like [Drosophila innubila]|uniref:prolyl 4-hydroxylase subunit alpha-2-like n=1 Tax=Drosophila innubila TaxID=198719 RepID=UPI00148E7120|nr:prolyl 4-hydroxylase subunit alpha-2-like [Drosophila innubila]